MSGQDSGSQSNSADRLQEAEHALRLSEERFKALTLYSGDIISLLDAEGRLLYNSPATERINGFTTNDLEGIDTFTLIHPEDQAKVTQVYSDVVAEPGAVRTVQYRYKTKDGRWLWMEAVASNQLDNPAVRGVVANSRDISKRVEAEERRSRLEAQMLHVQKLESLGVLAGGVAHDFNNLLTVILGEASLVESEDDLEEIRESARQIEDAARQAADLTQLLLAYAGKGRLEQRHISLAELVDGLHALLAVSVSKECVINYALDPKVPAIEADPRQIRQVVLNVVQNGSDAIDGEGTLRVSVGCRTLGLDHLAKCVVPGDFVAGDSVVFLRFEDTGAGMAEETLTRIFDPFYSTKPKGRGLGLAAVLGIVTGHKAALAVWSTLGEGTTFEFYFRPSSEPALSNAVSDAAVSWTGSGRVLVVDDEPGPARVACEMLARAGFDTVRAASGAEALELAEAEGGDLAMALVDMIMPRMDGAETLRRLRAHRRDLPVLLYSGYDGEVAADCLVEPRTAFLQKPFGREQLLRAVRRLLEPS